MAGEGGERDSLSKELCLMGVSACMIPAGFSPARFKLIAKLFVKRGGDLTSTIQSRTTHVVGNSWNTVQAHFAAKPLLWSRLQLKVKIVSFEWIPACLCEATVVNEEPFDLFLLHEDKPAVQPGPHFNKKRKALPILLPVPGAVDRVIEKVKAMDERAPAKRAKQLEEIEQSHKEVVLMMKEYRLGNWNIAEEIWARLKAYEIERWGSSEL